MATGGENIYLHADGDMFFVCFPRGSVSVLSVLLASECVNLFDLA